MCFGPLKRMCHWGPIAAFVIIKLVTLMTIHACNMWWPPYSSVGGFLNKAVFLLFSGLTLYNLITAIFEGPGYVPLKWVPEDVRDEAYLQFCQTCQGYKAPRAHHCRKCGRCVMKMDHHCPWINNCVGHQNHLHFSCFLLCAVIGCAQSTVILSCTLYRGFYRMWYLYHGIEPLVTFNIYSLVLTVFALGLSIGVVLAVGMLFYFQMRAILRNRTGIEDWIVEKAHHRRRPDDSLFVYPYDLGWKKNFSQVFSWGGRNRGDGITWPVVEGCHQYSLTIEQKEQKGEKRQRTRAYSVVHRYSGRWFPVVHGWRTCCNIPFTDEARIPLQPGDSVLVTRWRRYWLFGERTSSDGSKARGWFPRCCVVEISSCPEDREFPQPTSETKKTHSLLALYSKMNISVPRVKTCCFFCSLRNGTKFFGWFYLVSCLFGILGEVYLFSFYLAHSSNLWLRTIMFTDILLKSMQATFSLLLLLGAYQKEARYILWWVISNSVLTLLGIIGLTMLLITLHVITSTVVFYVFSNLIDIYSILVVYSYYYEISENLPV